MDLFGYSNTASRSLPIVAKGLTDKQMHEIDLDKGKKCKVKVTPFLNGEITLLKVRRTLYLVTWLILDGHYMILGILTSSSTLWSLPAFRCNATLKLWNAGCVVWDNVKMHHQPNLWRTGCGSEADRLPLLLPLRPVRLFALELWMLISVHHSQIYQNCSFLFSSEVKMAHKPIDLNLFWTVRD